MEAIEAALREPTEVLFDLIQTMLWELPESLAGEARTFVVEYAISNDMEDALHVQAKELVASGRTGNVDALRADAFQGHHRMSDTLEETARELAKLGDGSPSRGLIDRLEEIPTQHLEALLMECTPIPWELLYLCPTRALMGRAFEQARGMATKRSTQLGGWLVRARTLDWQPHVWPMLKESKEPFVPWTLIANMAEADDFSSWLELLETPRVEIRRHALCRLLAWRDLGSWVVAEWPASSPVVRQMMALAAYTLAWRDGDFEPLEHIVGDEAEFGDLVKDAERTWDDRVSCDDSDVDSVLLKQERDALSAWTSFHAPEVPFSYLPEHMWISLTGSAARQRSEFGRSVVRRWWSDTEVAVGEHTLERAMSSWMTGAASMDEAERCYLLLLELEATVDLEVHRRILIHGNSEIRRAALRSLAKEGWVGASVFVSELEEADPLRRSTAARGLALVADERAVMPLREALGRETEEAVRSEIEQALVGCDPVRRRALRERFDSKLIEPDPMALSEADYIDRLSDVVQSTPSKALWVRACELIDRARRSPSRSAVLDYVLDSPLMDWPSHVRVLPTDWRRHVVLRRLGVVGRHEWWSLSAVHDPDFTDMTLSSSSRIAESRLVFDESRREDFVQNVVEGWRWCHQHGLDPTSLVAWVTVMRSRTRDAAMDTVLKLEHGFGASLEAGFELGGRTLEQLGDRGVRVLLPPNHIVRDMYDVPAHETSIDLLGL